MINDFEIERFRLFNKLEIKKLNNINLIVGKNNSGKSAILEALFLYFTKASVDTLLELIISRQEHFEQDSNKMEQNAIRHLFHNHIIPNRGEKGISLSCDSKKDKIHIATNIFMFDRSEAGITRTKIKSEDYDSSDLTIENIEYYVTSEINDKITRLIDLHDNLNNIYRRRYRLNRPKISSIPVQYVSTKGISDQSVSKLWDATSLTEYEEEVIKGLQIIEPKVTGLAFIDNNLSRTESVRLPIVKLKGIKEPIPLKSLGDGMSRILQIVLSIVNAQNGVFIIDEFENGLHWSVQEQVWEVIFKLSKRLNVQVFSTTHSRDCIKGFQKIWSKNEKLGAFFRIYNKDNENKVKEYDYELLSDSLETDVEIR